jgi:hypothetical protein
MKTKPRKDNVTPEEYGRPTPTRIAAEYSETYVIPKPIAMEHVPRSNITLLNIDWSKVRPYRRKK